MAIRPLLTYADYAAIPNDGRRYELFVARTVEAFELAGPGYRLARTLAGAEAVSLSPFPDLRLEPTALWP